MSKFIWSHTVAVIACISNFTSDKIQTNKIEALAIDSSSQLHDGH
jgi:hypothetical protein